MKKKLTQFIPVAILPVLLVVIAATACNPGLKVIPEITPHIDNQSLLSLKDREAIGKVIAYNDKLVFVTVKGEVFRIDPVTQIVDFKNSLDLPLDRFVFAENGIVVLKRQDMARYLFFDLAQMKVRGRLKDVVVDKVVGVDGDLVVFKNGDRLIFTDYRGGTVKKELELPKGAALHGCHFTGSRVLVVVGGRLVTYEKGENTLDTLELSVRPGSGFLVDKGYIYFGSPDRELVKLSLKSGRVKWRFKLPTAVKAAPKKAGKYILVTPEDHNIYFFTTGGSLHWWEQFGAPRALPVVTMKDNVAVFLMNKQFRTRNNVIRFFNYKTKKTVSYKFKYLLESGPVYTGDCLYVLARDTETDEVTIEKIGNKFDIAVEIDPGYVKPVGRSIRFQAEPINLVEPEIKILIQDGDKKEIFSKEIARGEAASFIWMPDKAGKYKIILKADGKNRTGIETEKEFFVSNIEEIAQTYYYLLQRKCRDGWPKKRKAAKPGGKKPGRAAGVKTDGPPKKETDSPGREKKDRKKRPKKGKGAGKKRGQNGV